MAPKGNRREVRESEQHSLDLARLRCHPPRSRPDRCGAGSDPDHSAARERDRAWPPDGFATTRWFFGEGGTLIRELPMSRDATDEYMVDFTHTTGYQTRWHTQLGGGDVVDRLGDATW